tara:strand:+ start:73 stop:291 length:219 start_codon:yes stop_codon:yes gene_type:complete
MRINSYGRTASVMSTMQNRAIRKTEKTDFLTVMELQQMTMSNKDSSNHLSNRHKVDFEAIADAIIKSGDLKV